MRSPDSSTETVLPDRARSVITTNNSPDVGFDQSINPYRGCSHGCVYCFARPSHAYLGLIARARFRDQAFLQGRCGRSILEAELAKRNYVCKPIALGINTDGYQPLEKRLEVTRGILAVLARCRHPVTIVTKSALDLARSRFAHRPCQGSPGIRHAEHHLADRRYQAHPRAADGLAASAVACDSRARAGGSSRRSAGRAGDSGDHGSRDGGHPQRACEAGASSPAMCCCACRTSSRSCFASGSAEHYPDRAEHVMSLINQSRGGKDYDSQFGDPDARHGPLCGAAAHPFRPGKAQAGPRGCRERYELDTSMFRPPSGDSPQLSLGFSEERTAR